MRHDTENDRSTHTTINIGKRALVTGASSGIGAAIARELAALGSASPMPRARCGTPGSPAARSTS